ncbi:MAG: NADH-quinone oxidoreductase subunit C, partial [Hyphomicrobiales bacterium]
MDEALQELGEHIAAEIDTAVAHWEVAHGELNMAVVADQIGRALKFLRDDPACRFVVFIDICGVDHPERAERFDV